jgi:hypothetical protein
MRYTFAAMTVFSLLAVGMLLHNQSKALDCPANTKAANQILCSADAVSDCDTQLNPITSFCVRKIRITKVLVVPRDCANGLQAGCEKSICYDEYKVVPWDVGVGGIGGTVNWVPVQYNCVEYATCIDDPAGLPRCVSGGRPTQSKIIGKISLCCVNGVSTGPPGEH